jgi:hypothetical protein
MKLKKTFWESSIPSKGYVQIELLRDKKSPCYEHNHTLEHLDIVKRNSAIKAVAGEEVGKGYRASEVKRNMTGTIRETHKVILEQAGGKHLNLLDIHNAGAAFRTLNKDKRMEGHRDHWHKQRSDAKVWLEKEGWCAENIHALRPKNSKSLCESLLLILIYMIEEDSDGLVFAYPERLKILIRRGYFTIMDSTHNTNFLRWFLYTIMVRDEYGIWIPTAHILTAREDSDIIAEALRVLKRWCSGRWRLRYMLTDDSAGEQSAVSKAFRGLIDGEQEVTYLLCRVHSERTLNRKLPGKVHKAALNHLIAAFKFRQTKAGCEESIEHAIKAAPEKSRDYIRKEWFETRDAWANYARTHSCLLLQV